MSSSFTFGSSSNNNNNNNNQQNTSGFQWGASSNNTSNTNNNNTSNLNNTFNAGSNNNNNNNNNNSSNNMPNFNFGNSSNTNTNIGHNINPLVDISRLHNQYNAQHQQCRFESVLYNKIPATMNVNSFDKPPLIRPQIWDQGIKNNPYPNKLVPVGIRGYNELNQRSNLCLAGHCSAIKRFQEISEKINVLKDDIDIKTKQSITDLKQTQIYLSQRLLAILRAYIVKITNDEYNMNGMQNNNLNHSVLSLHPHNGRNNGNNNLSAMEVKLKNVLQQLSRESKQLVHLYAHVNKLSYNLDIDSRSKGANIDIKGSENVMNTSNYCNNAIVSTDLEHPDPRNMKQMFGFLKQQQMFVQLLSNTIQSDMKDLNVVQSGIQNATQNTPQMQSRLGANANSSIIYA